MNAKPRGARVAALLTAAQLGQAQWLYGNVYEALTRIPDRLAEHRDLAVSDGESVSLRSMLQAGSPVRYYLPVGPVTVGAAVCALVVGWDRPLNRRWLTVSAAGTLSAAAATAYIVHAINVRLFFDARPPGPAEQERLLRRWYRLNAIRIVGTSCAWLGAQRARSNLR